jgi:hypothetical protein
MGKYLFWRIHFARSPKMARAVEIIGLYQVAFSRTQLGITAAGTDARRMKMKYANSRKVEGRWRFCNDKQGGLGIRWNTGGKIFLKMLGFPVFSKTLALLRSSSLERDLILTPLFISQPVPLHFKQRFN